MILTQEQVIAHVETKQDPILVENVELQNDHKVHIYGTGFEAVLEQIIGYENVEQFKQKKLLTKPFTRPVFKQIMNAQGRWKNAQGTKKLYHFKDNKTDLITDFKTRVLSQVWKGKGIDTLINKFVGRAIYQEFNGFLMVDRDKIVKIEGKSFKLRDGILKPLKKDEQPLPYVVFIAAEDVKAVKVNGNTVEFIIIDFGKIKRGGKEIKLVRVLDDQFDYVVEILDGKAKISEKQPPIEHDAGRCPVVRMTDLDRKLTDDRTQTSPVDDIIQLLDYYLNQFAEHLVTEILHAHPNFFQVATRCMAEYKGIRCNEDGRIIGDIDGEAIDIECDSCKGQGNNLKKDASTTIIIPPFDEEGKAFNISNVAGYVSPPVDALTYQQSAIDWMENKILSAALGINNVAQSDKLEKTATEAVINLKPLEDIIGEIIDIMEGVETQLTDIMGTIEFGDKYIGSEIIYGRKLNLRDENILLKEISESKKAGVSKSHLNSLYEELTHTRFIKSNQDLQRNRMLILLEPIIGYTWEEVEESNNVDIETKRLKQNFIDLIKRFELENGALLEFKPDTDMKKRVGEIRDILLGYLKENPIADPVEPPE